MSNFPDNMNHSKLDESDEDRLFEAQHAKTQAIISALVPLCRLLEPDVVDTIVQLITDEEPDINVEDFPTFHSGPEHSIDRLFDQMPDQDCPLCGTHAQTSDPDVFRQTHRYHGQKVHIGLIHKDCMEAAQAIWRSDQEISPDDSKWYEIDSLTDFVDLDWIEENFPTIYARIEEKTNGQFSD